MIKKKFYLAISILAINFSFSQNINLKDSEVNDLLCQSWSFDYGLLDGSKIQGLENANQVYKFEKDNNYKLITSDSAILTGTWKFNSEKKRIELYRGKESSGYIKFIDKTHLTIIPGENSVPENVKLEFVFKSNE